MENEKIIPEVGMGATAYGYSDRYAYTIVQIVNPKTIIVQRDFARRQDSNGMSDMQDYDYFPNPNGEKVTVTLRSNGRWVTKGEGMKNGMGFAIGIRREYYDYGF